MSITKKKWHKMWMVIFGIIFIVGLSPWLFDYPDTAQSLAIWTAFYAVVFYLAVITEDVVRRSLWK